MYMYLSVKVRGIRGLYSHREMVENSVHGPIFLTVNQIQRFCVCWSHIFDLTVSWVSSTSYTGSCWLPNIRDDGGVRFYKMGKQVVCQEHRGVCVVFLTGRFAGSREHGISVYKSNRGSNPSRYLQMKKSKNDIHEFCLQRIFSFVQLHILQSSSDSRCYNNNKSSYNNNFNFAAWEAQPSVS